MNQSFLNDSQHAKIYNFLLSDTSVYARSEVVMRRIIEAIYWVTRSGAQWRMLPAEYGKWNSLYKRFSAWSDAGVFTRMHAHFIDDPDFESIMLDGSYVRAHACSAGAPKKKALRSSRLSDVPEEDSPQKSMP